MCYSIQSIISQIKQLEWRVGWCFETFVQAKASSLFEVGELDIYCVVCVGWPGSRAPHLKSPFSQPYEHNWVLYIAIVPKTRSTHWTIHLGLCIEVLCRIISFSTTKTVPIFHYWSQRRIYKTILFNKILRAKGLTVILICLGKFNL